jgi:hypothetical protein
MGLIDVRTFSKSMHQLKNIRPFTPDESGSVIWAFPRKPIGRIGGLSSSMHFLLSWFISVYTVYLGTGSLFKDYLES